MRKRLAILAACAACASLRAVEGQSLADAARRAEEGRKTTTATTVLNMRDVDSALARQELLGIQIDPGAALGASSVQPREYAGTHLALVLAMPENRGTPATIASLPPSVQANIAFIRAKQRDGAVLTTPLVRPAQRIVAPPSAVAAAGSSAAPARPAASAVKPAATALPPPATPAGSTEGSFSLQPGAVIADFRFVDFNGFTRSFSEFRGKYVMLSFWGTWCPYCRAEIHFANDAYARFQSRGFEILGMDYEKRATVEDVRRFIRSNSISWTVARPDSVDTLITERFGVRSYPTIVLVDPEGRVLPVRESALRGEALAATLDRILPK